MSKGTILLCLLFAGAAAAPPALLLAASGTPYDPYVDQSKKKVEEAQKKAGTAMQEVPPLDPEVVKQIQAAQNMGILDSQTQQTLQGVIEGDYSGAEKAVEYKKGIDIQKNEEARIKKFSTPLEKKPLVPPAASEDKMGGLNLQKGKLRSVDFGGDKKDDEKLRPKTFAGQQSGNSSGNKAFASGGGFAPLGTGTSGSGGGPPGPQAGSFHPMQRRKVGTDGARGDKALQPMQDPFASKREAQDAKKAGSAPSKDSGPLTPEFTSLLGDPEADAGAKDPKSVYAKKEAEARAELAKDPKNPDAYAVLAQSQIGQGRYQEAVGSADKAIDAAPKNASAHALRAIAHEQLGNKENALHDLRVAAAIDKDRFHEPYEKARAGQRLFDPGREDSWFLLEAIVPPARPSGSRDAGAAVRRAAGVLIALLSLAGAGILLRRYLRRLSSEERRTLESTLKSAVDGQVLPKVRTEAHSAPAPDEPLYDNAVICSKYRLLGRIAVDGEVQVWKAFDKTLARSVLVKRFPTAGRSPDSRTRLLEQIKSTATLHHPNIVDIFEIIDRETGVLVVLEYASGKTLRKVLEELGPLQFKQAREILIPVCRALEHSFRHGLVHGGLSPERIILTQQGYVKVSDFVLARLLGATDDVYLAPEARGQGVPTRASDIYSVGATLFEMLTGQRALSAEETAAAGLPLAVRMLLVQLMEADAATRLSSPIEVIQALQELPDESG